MTDNDIFQAWELCMSGKEEACNECPYFTTGCIVDLHNDTYYLIKRQLAEIERLQQATSDKTSEWISVEDRLPESGVHVLVACEMRGQYLQGRYVCDGYYAKAKTHPSYGNPDECAVEYIEEDDEYYLLEGWYEVIKNWDDYSSIVIDDFVTHWMPLPEPPKGD